MKILLRKEDGFTLIEMLIVVIVLGILAMIIIPQINVSTSDAKQSTLRTNLSTVRNAIELYYHQHNNTYPGAILSTAGGTTATTSAAEAESSFLAQLVTYTQVDGLASADKTGLTGTIYGPYLKTATLPTNPYNESSAVTCDIATASVLTRTAVPGDGTGWKFYVKTGVFIANDSTDHDDY